ncbi:MAG: hypothetical protein IJ876_05595 [Elusimicrobiaceae bacterium]|nr:hypothetical protein [Elusimicrobiaceae bacterium]
MGEGLKAIHEKINSAKMDNVDKTEFQDAYQLRFIGKNYAKFIADLPTETLLVPNTEWNNLSENLNSQNIFITGDNLPVLKHLQNAYYNSVDVIYIDPPYNTGSDGFIYNDKFEFTDEQLKDTLSLTDDEIKRLHSINGKSSHSAWLTFMYPRLKIASKLLKDTGVIFINIDYNEQANLKLLCDEIFGERNFQREIIWRIGWVSGFKSGENIDNFVRNHDTILYYTKCKDKVFFNKTNAYTTQEDFGSRFNSFKDKNSQKVINPKQVLLKDLIDMGIDKKKAQEFINKADTIGLPEKYPIEDTWNCSSYDKLNSIAIESFSHEKVSKMLGIDEFKGQKSIKLISRIIKSSPNKNAVVLDFFGGSGSTAHAVMKLNSEDGGNRRWILVQLDEPTWEVDKSGNKKAKENFEKTYNAGYETIDQVSRARIEYAAKELGDTSGFKHYYIKEPNAVTLDKITEFDPKQPALIAEDMVEELGGEDVLLTTWLVADGYKLTDKPQEIDLAGYRAYYCDNSVLYLIKQGWGKEQTQTLLNLAGKNKLNLNTIICFGYSFTLESMEELEINVNQSLNHVKVEKRY